MAFCPQPEGAQQVLCSQSTFHGPCATVVEQPARRTRQRSDASSEPSAAFASRAQSAAAEPATAARSRSSTEPIVYSGAALAAADGSPVGRMAQRRFPPRACPAGDAPQGESAVRTGSDRSQLRVRATADSTRPAEVGSAAPATRTQFPAGRPGLRCPESASTLASSGVLDSSQRTAAQQASQTTTAARQLRGSRPASGGATSSRHPASTVLARGACRKVTRHGRSRSAAAVPALLALCLLCLTGAATAANPIVRAAVAGNAATSMAILVCMSVPDVRGSQPFSQRSTK